jgi:hypothetical protein
MIYHSKIYGQRGFFPLPIFLIIIKFVTMAIKERWFHVIPQDKSPAWGFALENGKVTKSAVYSLIGKTADQIRSYFTSQNLKVYKVL